MPRPFLVIAALTGAVQTLLGLPALLSGLAMAEVVVEVMGDAFARAMANPEAYTYADQATLQADLEARFRAVLVPYADLAPITGLGAGLGGAIGLVGTAALTGMALSVAAGRPVPVRFAFRLVAARAGLLVPIVALGIGWMAVSWLSLGLQGSPEIQAWTGAPGSPRSVLVGSLLGVAAIVLVVGIIVLAVRWALYVPAVLVEALGVGAGLARAARLTRGIRIRLGLAMAGIVAVQVIAIALVASAVGLAVGLASGSVQAGFATYVVATVVVGAAWAPWLPATLADAYRQRTYPGDATEAPAGESVGTDAPPTDAPSTDAPSTDAGPG